MHNAPATGSKIVGKQAYAALAALPVVPALLMAIITFAAGAAFASDTYRFPHPCGGAEWEWHKITEEYNGRGSYRSFPDQGGVQVFECIGIAGGVNVKQYLRFILDPKEDLDGAGEYEIRVRFNQISSNYTFGFMGMGCHKALARMQVDYDMDREVDDEWELISAEKTVAEDGVDFFLDGVGLLTASGAAEAAEAVIEAVIPSPSVDDLLEDLGGCWAGTYELKTSIELRNPELHVLVSLGAEVTGAGLGLAHMTGAFVLLQFEEVVIKKTKDLTPIAEIQIAEPSDSVIYRDEVSQLPIAVRIWDEEGKTNLLHPYVRLFSASTSASEEMEVSIDVPKGDWTDPTTIWTVDLDQLDPNQQAEKGYVYIPAIWMETETRGYYTATARFDFKVTTHRPPTRSFFTVETDTGGFQHRPVYFEANAVDPDEDQISYQFCWGDGDTTQWLGPRSSGVPKGTDHTYAAVAEYPVKVRAKDQRDMLSEWSEVDTIGIRNLPGLRVSADVIPDTSYWGSDFRLILRPTDPGPDSAKFWIDWGDSTQPFWTDEYYPDGERQTFIHAYDETVGVKHIRIRAADVHDETTEVVARDIAVLPVGPIITMAEGDGDSIMLEWMTQANQKVLDSCWVVYSVNADLSDSTEVPVPVEPYETRLTISGLPTSTIYYFQVREKYTSAEDTRIAKSFLGYTMTSPYAPTVQFLAPGKDTLKETVTIEWLATDPDPGDSALLDIDMDYSLNGAPWDSIGPDFDRRNDGSYLWNTLNDSDGVYLIRLIAKDLVGRRDTAFSDTLVVDNPDRPWVDLTAPGAGVNWSRSHDITWVAVDADGEALTIDIEYSPDWGQSWSSLATGEPDDGSYDWNTESQPDGAGYQIKVTARDPEGLTRDALSGYFTVDNTPPQPVELSSVTPSWDAQNGYCVDLEWPSADDLSPPVTYYVYWGASEATIDTLTPICTTNATSCGISGLPPSSPGSCFFIIAADDAADQPNDTLNADAQSVYFTQSYTLDNSLVGLTIVSQGVVTGTSPDYQFNGSVVVVPQDQLWTVGDNCTFTDTTGSSCIKVYGRFTATGTTFQAQNPGDWRGIVFEDSSIDYGGGAGCSLSVCTIMHAVDGVVSLSSQQLIADSDINSHSHAGINCYESDAVIVRNNIYGNDYGIYCDREGIIPPCIIQILDNEIHDNSISGTHFAGGAKPVMTGNTIHTNSDGCTWSSGAFATSFHHNDIFANSSYGAINYAGPPTIIAEYNWWGASSGPSGAGPGSGDSVSTWVDYAPFLTASLSGPVIDLGTLEGPSSVTLSVGGTTPDIYGQVFEEDVTEGPGQGGGIEVELGYGADGSNPWDGGWYWQPAVYNGDQGDYDEYFGVLEVYSHGSYDYCYRYSMDVGDTWVYADLDGNDTGSGGLNGYSVSQAGSLMVGTNVTILLVDDDMGSWTEEFFTEALDSCDLSYALWEVDSLGSPGSDDLGRYDIVVWTTGDAGQTLSGSDEDNLMWYLNTGGRLFLSSQDYLDEKCIGDSFPAYYLHTLDWDLGVGTTEIEGMPYDPITDGMYISLDYPFTNGTDSISTDSAACPIFVDPAAGGFTALRYPDEGPSYYKVVFFAFPFDAVDPVDTRVSLMDSVVKWLRTPCVPYLYQPEDSTVVNETTTAFEWSSAAGIGGYYTLQYALDSDFMVDAVTVDSLTDSCYNLPAIPALSDDEVYYWRVKAANAAGDESDYQQDPFTFTADYSPDVPSLVSPNDSAVANDRTPELVWSPTAGVGGWYTLEYALDSTLTAGLITVSGLPGTTYTVTDSLADSSYYWHVKAHSSLGYPGCYQSHAFMFTVDTELPAIPVLISPDDLTGLADSTPELTWSPTVGPGGTYTLEYAPDSTFAGGVVTLPDLTDTTYTVSDPLSDDPYYWHVEGIDLAGNHSTYQSHPFCFIVDTQEPQSPVLVSPEDSSLITECEPTFQWISTAGTGGTYTLQYALDSAFTCGLSVVHDIPGTTYSVSYPFPSLVDTTYYWHVEARDIADNQSGFQQIPFSFGIGAAGVFDPEVSVPAAFALSQNFPNPFRSATQIRYALPRDCYVHLALYNVLGQRVATLVDGRQEAGYKMACWDCTNQAGARVSSGIYFCRLQAGNFVATKKLVLLR